MPSRCSPVPSAAVTLHCLASCHTKSPEGNGQERYRIPSLPTTACSTPNLSTIYTEPTPPISHLRRELNCSVQMAESISFAMEATPRFTSIFSVAFVDAIVATEEFLMVSLVSWMLRHEHSSCSKGATLAASEKEEEEYDEHDHERQYPKTHRRNGS